MRKLWCSLQLKFRNLIISIKQCTQKHLMDDVWYQDEPYFINNGNRYDEHGNHYWTILRKEQNPDGTREKHYVQDHEIKRMFTWFNIKNALFSHYRWWKDYWYLIDLRTMMEE